MTALGDAYRILQRLNVTVRRGGSYKDSEMARHRRRLCGRRTVHRVVIKYT